MVQTYQVKELSKLAGVSVRTLHYYDNIGLLKPTIVKPNGHRFYSNEDCLKLQYILSLKCIGFSLKRIKRILREELGYIENLELQAKVIDGQIKQLQKSLSIIRELINIYKVEGSVKWEQVIKLIEVINMTEELKQNWANDVYDDRVLQQLASMREKYTQEQIREYQNKWNSLITKVKANLDKDPKSDIAINLAKEWKQLTDEIYGKFPELKKQIKTAYEQNKLSDHPLDQEVLRFIQHAMASLQKDD